MIRLVLGIKGSDNSSFITKNKPETILEDGAGREFIYEINSQAFDAIAAYTKIYDTE